jgi:putative ABC transport system permease protein
LFVRQIQFWHNNGSGQKKLLIRQAAMINLSLKLAFRSLLKNRIYSFLIIGGFALGFAACIIIGLYYHTEITVNEGFTNHRNIYRIYDVKLNKCNLNWDLFPALTSGYAAIDDACPFDYQDREQMTIKDEETKNSVQINQLLSTTNNFFSIFSVKTIQSLTNRPFVGREAVAISNRVAKSLFGNLNPLGRTVNIGNYFYGTVTAVFNDLPVNSSFKADVILNSENEKYRFSTTDYNGKRYNPTNLFVLLKNGTDPRSIAGQLNKSLDLKRLYVDSLALQSLDDIYLSTLTIKSRHAKGNPALLKIFLAISLLILVLSSINFLNYSASMQYSKLKETGIKMTFGAGWKDLVKNTILEVTFGILISLVLALVFTDIALPYCERLFGKPLMVKWDDLLAISPFFLLVVAAVIMLNSFAPLYLLSRFNITEFLSGSGIKPNGKQIWKKLLVTFQLTVSIALITIVMIIFKQIRFVSQPDPGFDKELLMRVNIPFSYEQTRTLRQEIDKLPFVVNTALSSGCPGMINHRMDGEIDGKDIVFNCIYVGDNFLKTMDLELAGGRDFLNGDLKKACLMNEEGLRQSGWNSFRGKKFDIGQETGFEVIGIIKDFKYASFHKAVEPLVLIFDGAGYGNVLSVRLVAGNTRQQVDQIAHVWKSVSPDEQFSFIFYDDYFQSFYEKEEKLAGSITFFSIIAIALTCMGILGQIFMICMTRVKEIGIRKINGAKIYEVLFILNSDFIKWFIVAFLLAAPVSMVIADNWLKNFAYRTSISWWIFILGGVLILLIIVMTVSWQSWRAATRNPVEALRYE